MFDLEMAQVTRIQSMTRQDGVPHVPTANATQEVMVLAGPSGASLAVDRGLLWRKSDFDDFTASP